MGPDTPAALIERLSQAIERQRAALVGQDAEALQPASEELVSLLESLRSLGELRAEDAAALSRARAALRVNAELLARSASANARALGVLFDESAVYGPGGAAALARPSRPLRSA